MKQRIWMAFLAMGLCTLGCGDGGGSDAVEDPELADLDVLMDGAPDKADLVDEKTDLIVPVRSVELAAEQSPVRSQGSRGVCSIFSTVALMEHLYIKSGAMPDPDFSEQYLQWSVKSELGAFPNTSGSNAASNLRAINRYGIVLESDWPYETYQWSSSNDPECTGEDMPTKCYTNGDPPEPARQAAKYKLPQSRWISSSPDSIKNFMVNKKQAVIVGGTFFYQAWNHGRSTLPTSSEYKRKGYVLSPNEKDREESLAKRAGHSFLLVGWDDELEVQRVDADGQKMVDADGEPVMEKGFFLFKNSWGTGSFGSQNPEGDGYGWIAYRYVEDYLSANAADVPEVEPPDEICGDELDNDEDGKTDCDDSDCAALPQCQTGPQVYTNDTPVDIPDDDPDGASSTIEVVADAEIDAVSVGVTISHTFTGDLEILIAHPDGSQVQLQQPWQEAGETLVKTYVTAAFDGKRSAGTWTLRVIDHGAPDIGRLNAWTLKINSDAQTDPEICDDQIDNDLDGKTDCQDPECEQAPGCDQNEPEVYSNETPVDIPDDDPDGVTSSIQVDPGGAIAELSLDVEITHSYSGDLQIDLSGPDGTRTTVLEASGSSAPDIAQRFACPAFAGKDSAGTWTLTVKDLARQDTGSLDRWSLIIRR
ncbi:MAG: proprotein convertase P-domain-containing protein [Deltaproteobacteria bacterium]|nr:proprotein convertase P-domain-containing protein [Deltaproteobacteria bacterium]